MNPPPSSNPIPRVAIIGVTGYAAVHLAILRDYAASGRLRLCAATVINREEAAATCAELEREGCTIFPDYRAMLAACAGRIDLCLIPTAPQWHAEMSVAALETGCQVLLEKPLAPTRAEIAAIQAAEARTGRWVAVGFQDLHTPQIRALRARLAAGEWGPVERVSTSCFWPRPRSYYARNRWAGRLVVDGRQVLDSPLSNAMAHFVMLALHLAAPADAEACEPEITAADLRRANRIESFDTFSVSARTREGVELRFVGSHACPRATTPELVVHTAGARLVWRQGESLLVEPRSGPAELCLLPDLDATRRHLLDAVLGRLAGRGGFVCGSAAAAAHARFYIGLHRAHPIQNAEPARLRSHAIGDDELRWIDGIREELDASLEVSAPAAAPLCLS